MIKLKNLLFEGRSESIKKDKVLSYFKSNKFGLGLESPAYIGRHISSFDSNYGIVRPSNYLRKSEHTDNYYTLIIDNSGRWSEYSKRSRSVVCRTRSFMSGLRDYLVVPQYGSNVGVCPKFDFWDGFRESGIHSLRDSFNRPLNILSLYVEKDYEDLDFDSLNFGAYENMIPDDNYSEFRSYIQSIDSFIKDSPKKSYQDFVERTTDNNNEISKLFKSYIDSKFQNLYEFLDYKLDPERNGFKSVDYKPGFNFETEREIWTDGPCLLIKTDKISHIRDELDNFDTK